MNNVDRAVACFREGFSCSQAILSTYGRELGMDKDMALGVSGSFGGGMASMAETCGAVTGAFMVIGLKYGKTKADDEEAKKKTYVLVREFVDRFKSRNGSIVCRELLGYDISIPEGMKAVKREEAHRHPVPAVCRRRRRDP
jgi:C_GCAxxG_C_C family probable redox protein